TPVNWWVAHHINEGKRKLNFTEFGNYTVKRQSKKLDEVAETVESDEMPLNSYLIMHGDAKLSTDEKKLLIDWAKAAMNQVKQVPVP
ncbi:MAG: cytochrome C, partial [Chitinophagaceae bacterium]